MHLIAIFNINLHVINNAQKSVLRSCRSDIRATYEDCLDTCRRRQSSDEIFSLLDGLTDVQSLDTAGPLCVFSTVGIDDRYQSGSCEHNKCGKHETCVNPKYQKSDKQCVITECPAPPAIENALLLSNTRAIGTRNRYKCMIGFMGNGSPAIDCLTNGSWTFTDFQRHTEQLIWSNIGMQARLQEAYNNVPIDLGILAVRPFTMLCGGKSVF
ncbi:hypothetical protein DPMN_045232 [Dreissena polymorpha]|uniref:Sushi domain-containing protein n=1 Tax=Dreissena polymorpha TaxID=45954 RepID=A0A9D4HZG4_DREPO|nr:hypothetical protein DPMN_045232 [Dreissena polymorpha]